MQTTIGRTVALVLTALAAAATAATLTGCTASGAPPDGSGGLADQVLARSSDLAAALDTVPLDTVREVPGSYVMFTDWSMLGHRLPKDSGAEPFAADLLNVDAELQRDLGIRSTSADWEIDMWQPRGPGTIVLHFDKHTDLAGLAAATTGVDALTFADQRTAQANKASRSAMAKMLNGVNPDGIRVADSTVTGHVLSFALTARKPHDIVEVVLDGTLGVDLCR